MTDTYQFHTVQTAAEMLSSFLVFSSISLLSLRPIQSKTGDRPDLWKYHYEMSISEGLNAVLRPDVLAQ